MSEKQAKRLRRMEKDVENIRDGLKEATCGAYEQEVRLSDAESGLKDQDARLKKLEGGLDSFQRYLLETKDHAALKAQDERWTAVRRAIDAEQAVRIWKASVPLYADGKTRRCVVVKPLKSIGDT